MSIKITKSQLEKIILEELEEIRTDGRGFSPAMMATSKALASRGVAKKPESVRRRLMQIVADLDMENPTVREIEELADMVSQLMDAAGDADEFGLEESHSKKDEEKIKDIISQLRKASKMHAGQADELQKVVDSSPDDELKEEDEVNEGMNCGCGKDPCETYGKNNEKLVIMIKEELDAVIDEKKKKKKKKSAKDKMKCNSPRRIRKGEAGHGKKKFVVKACDGGTEKIIRYGDANMEIKKDSPKRRKSFRARHNCKNPGSKLKARYWSCKKW